MGRDCVVLVSRSVPLISFVAAVGLATLPTMGRDLDGRYANSPLKPWFDQLKSRNGLCCSMADGYVVEDADWETKAIQTKMAIQTYGSVALCQGA